MTLRAVLLLPPGRAESLPAPIDDDDDDADDDADTANSRRGMSLPEQSGVLVRQNTRCPALHAAATLVASLEDSTASFERHCAAK